MCVTEGLAGPYALLRGLVQARQAPRLATCHYQALEEPNWATLGVREGAMLVLRAAGPLFQGSSPRLRACRGSLAGLRSRDPTAGPSDTSRIRALAKEKRLFHHS